MDRRSGQLRLMIESTPTNRPRPLRTILLLLTLLTSPLICCGSVQLLDVLPASLLPPSLNFIINIFESEARVENKTTETFYITAITTTYGEPRVIGQNTSVKQRDIPLAPNSSVILTYDSADMPLAGIAVCRTEDDCRLLKVDYSGSAYILESYEALPNLESNWLEAIHSHPLNNYMNVLLPVLCLVPIFLFVGWLYVTRAEKKKSG